MFFALSGLIRRVNSYRRLTNENATSSQPIILAVDTSSRVTSLAVAQGEKLLRSSGELRDEKRSETLWSEVQSLLEGLGKTISDVEVFGVCTGPGAFTGLRVGISAVKGFSAATNQPIVGVTSLEAAATAAGVEGPVCVMVNAYKGEVYSQLFSLDGDELPQPGNEPMVTSYQEALERVADLNELTIAGDAVEVGKEIIQEFVSSHRKPKWTLKESMHELAVAIAKLAYLRSSRGEFNSADALKACYVRPSEAEIKLSLGLLGSKIKRSMRS
jgi:tRNA threonylcarbamoyladenosine biosynthesis protein TsaB